MRPGRLVVLASAALALLAAGAPAGAAPAVGKVTVSNPAPHRASAIEVSSTGWRPGSVVTITLSDAVIARTRAGASGAVDVRVAIPADAAVGFDVLSVNGATETGVPQEIVTGLSVLASGHAPAPAPPWTLVCALAAVAALLLLAGQRVERPDRTLAPVS